MNKKDLADYVAAKKGLTKQMAGEMVDTVLGGITGAMTSGHHVTLAGFGVFAISERAAHQGRDPRTGETIMIPATKVVKFKPAKAMKDAVNS